MVSGRPVEFIKQALPLLGLAAAILLNGMWIALLGYALLRWL
jgi:hypothetical protein